MKHLKINWKSRATLLLVVSIIISLLMISLELTSWAEQLNQQGNLPHGDSHGGGHGGDKGKGDMPSILRYILPFVKEIVLIGVPLFITLGLMKLTALCKRMLARSQQQ